MTDKLNIKAQRMKFSLICCALFFTLFGQGQTQWGPNALPVINMSAGETSEELSVEISGSYFRGFDQSNSFTPNLRLNIPLFSRWANLEAQYSIYDIYHPTPNSEWNGIAGDIYVSTNIQVLHYDWFNSSKFLPSAVARISIKTASGGDFENKRFIDAPEYFLDLSIAEKIQFNNCWIKSISIVGNIGFYCWQIEKAKQNDAYMYGIRTELNAKYLHFIAEWSGYTEWQNNGDCPMVLKSKLGIPCSLGFEPYIAYQYGIRDWLYQGIQIGLKFSIDIIK